MSKLIDNSNLQMKVALRRQMLDAFPLAEYRVFDCCEGDKAIWRMLSQEYKVKYFGVDRKPQRGRLKFDSARLIQCGMQFDVIDIDTYGSPWNHWYKFLPCIQKECLIFMTVGQAFMGGLGARLLPATKHIMGLNRLNKLPLCVESRLKPLERNYALTYAAQYDILIVQAKSIIPHIGLEYIGIRAKPKGD